MNDADFFPARPDVEPMIYAYEEKNPRYAGMLKVGFASAGVESRPRDAGGYGSWRVTGDELSSASSRSEDAPCGAVHMR